MTTSGHALDRRRSDAPPSIGWRAARERVRDAASRLVAGRRGTVLAVAVVGAAVALPLPTLFRYQGAPMEEGFMLVFPERVLAGDIPNRDFLHLYGPASLWSLAAWYELAGTTLASERFYGLLQHLGIIFGLFRLALPWGRRTAVACGLMAVLLVVTPIGLAALAWNGAVALGLLGSALCLRGATRITAGHHRSGTWHLRAAGAVFGLTLLFRPDLVVALGLAGVALFWGRWRRELIVPLVVGGAVGLAPFLVHLATAGVGNVVEGMFLEPVFELRGGRHLPIPPSWGELDGALQKVAQLRVPDWPVPMLEPSQQVTLWFLALPIAAAVVLGTGIVAWRRDGDRRARVLLVVGAFGAGLLPQAVQRPDTTHLAWVSCVSMVFLPVALVQWGEWRAARRGPGPRRLRGVRRASLALIPLVLLVTVVPAYTARTWTDLTRQNLTGDYFGWEVRRGDRTFYLGAPEIAASAQAAVDVLDARIAPGDRLFVGTADLRKTPYSDAYVYYLFPEATPATRYIEMDPGIANAPDSGLAEEVAAADWLVLSHVWDPWSEPNDSELFGTDRPNQVVRDEFCRIDGTGDYYLVYERCG